MPLPQGMCILPGKAYHEEKQKFKGILKEHGVKWKKVPGQFIWSGDNEWVRGRFNPLSEEDKRRLGYSNEEVKLEYHVGKGKKETAFRDDLENFCKSVGGKVLTQPQAKTVLKGMVSDQLKEWEDWNKPRKQPGEPEGLFNARLGGFKDKKSEEKKRIEKSFGF